MCKVTDEKQNDEKYEQVHKEDPTPIELKTTFTLKDSSNDDKGENK